MRMMLKVLANAITFSGYLAATVVGHAQTVSVDTIQKVCAKHLYECV